MLVQVDNDIIVDIPDSCGDSQNARMAAFRHIHKRREKDWNEIVHATRVITTVPVSRDAAEVYLSNYGKG